MLQNFRTPSCACIITLHLSVLILLFVVQGCNQSTREPLPILITVEVPYTFTDQDNSPVDQEMFAEKIYVADFFFTSCPTICPIMKTQMLRVYEKYKDDQRVVLLSHTIDPEHDTVEVLSDYGTRLGIEADRWHLVTGNKEEIYNTARLYGLAAMEDKNAPGGFIHSGSFTLVDRQGRIRGYYRGTEEEAVDRLIDDIAWLLNED
ncbi:MAG: SCO family protein [Desulfofustis sp.]|nr:SCO family protein [Desulfofustis sp.]MBT8345762.1 SCO family protein [Desulfofustis sp.]MBT8354726.1 SCO family protein [Desulfofustis sp.]NNF46256.1 SCO family protein [Desulfofustis sp.]NNK58578.1 SCO family protein [Desulfofustis sp.]